MSRHQIAVRLSRSQLAYLADAIEADIESSALTPEGHGRARSVLAKVERALEKRALIECGPECGCRTSPSDLRREQKRAGQ